ncbi:MAG: biopolymer transporter ExbD [bacterium]
MENAQEEILWEIPEDSDDEGVISEISIIPVISICLVLLVVLMITAPVLNIPNLSVNLPEAATQESKEKNITVSLSADGTIAVKTYLVTKDTFLKRFIYELHKEKDSLVIIRADKELPYSEVENLMRVIKKAGAQRIAFGTEQTKEILLK